MAKKQPVKMGLWEALRDVLIESMRKGQLPPVAVGMLIAIFLIKTPETYYPQLWDRIFQLHDFIIVCSLMLNIILTLSWYFHSKSMRKTFKNELERIVQERNELQMQCGASVLSSARKVE